MSSTTNPGAFDSILLIAFGGPPTGAEGYPFVKGIVGDRPAGEARIKEVAGHYEHLGGSPFNKLTYEQGLLLERELAGRGIKVPVHTGFRHWAPWIKDVVAGMVKKGHRKTLGLILAPHQCWVSWDWYKDTVSAAIGLARDPEGPAAAEAPLAVTYADPWWTSQGYIDASVDKIRAAFTSLADKAKDAALIFTAHSIPINLCAQCKSGERKCPYTPQFEESAKLIATALAVKEYQISYQSQASTHGQWTQPDINALLEKLHGQGTKSVVLAPIGFLCDHVEVLFDLDVEARKTCEKLGVTYARASTVGSHPAFIKLLADKIQERFDGAPRLMGELVLS